jgi:uncharacterized Zn-binding protein involved in type VI secretion
MNDCQVKEFLIPSKSLFELRNAPVFYEFPEMFYLTINDKTIGKPAARIGDMHMCPMVTPAVPPIPHVGGPVIGPGCPTVLIGGQPSAVMGDMCVCTGPPDTIILGSTGVFIGGKPAARMGDQCAHGGVILLGCPTVLIGESGSGGASGPSASSAPPFVAAVNNVPPDSKQKVAQILAMRDAAANELPFCEVC